MRTWAGGGATAGRPPRPRHSLARPGCVIPGINRRKKIVNVRSRKSTAYTLQKFFECVTDINIFDCVTNVSMSEAEKINLYRL
jgi:hypothetical protein